MKKQVSSFVQQYAYWMLTFPLTIYILFLVSKGQWIGDFWEHCAVIKELSQRTIYPLNPIIGTETTHAFFSPYSIFIGLLSSWINLKPLEVMTIVAAFNLFYFLLGFYFFCRALFPNNTSMIASISLIFILLFWGQDPPIWSGFFHIRVIHWILPYPSTFAIATSFMVLSILVKRPIDIKRGILFSVLGAFVFVTHPTTGIFIYTAMANMILWMDESSLPVRLIKAVLILVTSAGIAYYWPYYDIYDLMLNSGIDFHIGSFPLYQIPFDRYWPILVVLPLLPFLKKANSLNFLLSSVLCFFIIFCIGYSFEIQGVGRAISNMMLFGHILMGHTIFDLSKNRPRRYFVGIAIVGILFSISLYQNRRILRWTIDPFRDRDINYYEKLAFLENYVQPESVILSDSLSNNLIPVFNGKVIGTTRPLYWVENLPKRRSDVYTFFLKETPDSVRQQILQLYRPNYVLLDHTFISFKKHTIQWLDSIGTRVYYKNEMELIRLPFE